MSFSFSSLIRLTAFLAIGATMFAVSLSRVERPTEATRTRQHPSQINVNEYYLGGTGRHPHWFDADSGRIVPMPVIEGDVLESSSRSPWVDETGQGQVIGRWSTRSDRGPTSTAADFGLARYTFPEGTLLNHVSSDVMPIAPPAWYPGTSARILFPGGDGRLYHFAFERTQPGSARPIPDVDTRPRPIAWQCTGPGLGEPYISDVQWPDDARLGGYLVATLRWREADSEGNLSFARNHLWWLRLDPTGTAIVDRGRLIDDDREVHDERNPTIAALPDGRLVASYLYQSEDDKSWQIRLGIVRNDPERKVPEIVASTIRTLDGQFQPAFAGFSADGRHLAVVMGQTADRAYPAWLSTASILFPDEDRLALAGAASNHHP